MSRTRRKVPNWVYRSIKLEPFWQWLHPGIGSARHKSTKFKKGDLYTQVRTGNLWMGRNWWDPRRRKLKERNIIAAYKEDMQDYEDMTW